MAKKHSNGTSDLQSRFTERASESGAPLLAGALKRYANLYGQSWEQLAADNGLTANQLHQIASCGIPKTETYEADVQAIAEYVGMPVGTLDRLLNVSLANYEEYTMVAEAPATYHIEVDKRRASTE